MDNYLCTLYMGVYNLRVDYFVVALGRVLRGLRQTMSSLARDESAHLSIFCRVAHLYIDALERRTVANYMQKSKNKQ